MKTWKLVSGIISIVLSVFVVFQSMIAGLANALEESGQVSLKEKARIHLIS